MAGAVPFERVATLVINEIIIATSPDTVWAWLVRASAWPEWYPYSEHVKIEDGGSRRTRRFTWRTFVVAVRSTACEFEPSERIGGTVPAFKG
jgi:uncharacterized protein YndB with AHSA1/START domain